MDPEIRKAIIVLLRVSSTRSIESLKPEIGGQLKQTQQEALRVLRLMEDLGEVEILNPDTLYARVRLTAKGVLVSSPLWERTKRYMLNYLSTHWLALIAVIISIIALVKK